VSASSCTIKCHPHPSSFCHSPSSLTLPPLRRSLSLELSPSPSNLPPFHPTLTLAGGFPGFYALLLPARCWDTQDKRILLHNWWRSTQDVLCVEVEGGTVHRMTGGEGERGAWTVLDVSHDLIVAQFATPNTPPKLVSGRSEAACYS